MNDYMWDKILSDCENKNKQLTIPINITIEDEEQ